jgi:hypothetical protein
VKNNERLPGFVDRTFHTSSPAGALAPAAGAATVPYALHYKNPLVGTDTLMGAVRQAEAAGVPLGSAAASPRPLLVRQAPRRPLCRSACPRQDGSGWPWCLHPRGLGTQGGRLPPELAWIALCRQQRTLSACPPARPQAPEPPTKTTGTQSDYRESEAQTLPWSPDYVLTKDAVRQVRATC